MDLSDKVVLITGAAGNLGGALTRLAAGTGARIALTARLATPVEDLVRKVGLPPERTLIQSADLANGDDVGALVEAIAARWGGVDVLLNTAGGWSGGSRLGEMSVDAWDSALEKNLRTAFLVCRAVLPHMLERGWGRIINVASRAALEPGVKQAAYNVSKAGVLALTASIAQDYKRKGITANAILPSTIDTPENRAAMPDADHSRWVKVEDVAAMMLFLCGDEAASISGAAIPMYGGV